MNSVQLIGRLVEVPERTYGAGDVAILRFRLAVNDYKKDTEEYANFFNCTMFGKQAEILLEYLGKGTLVGVSGRLHQERWTNKEGQNRSRVVILVNWLDLLRQPGERCHTPLDLRVPSLTQIDDSDDIPF